MERKHKPVKYKIEQKKGYQRLMVPGENSSVIKSGCVTLAPGESVGEHSTEKKEEAILILQGKAEISCGEGIIEAGEKNIVYMPPETKHNVKNAGKEMLQYVFMVIPV